MTSLISFANCNSSDVDKINALNSYRGNYTFSSKIYSLSNIDNVYFIVSNGGIVGFVEVEYINLCIDAPGGVYIFLHELHLATKMQGKSIGFEVIILLLTKIPIIELVVANANSSMNKLVGKFKILRKDPASNTTTFRISN
ncbi:hypothetical protein FDP61_10425 [Enterobacter ludwigii]|uniref:hypothetical protein n=1 Tax=Enterobacter ludwigii TaxID=299767 RepID=UPI00129CEDFC|nr:hypothetical protein [Enterobacter ludwigii]MRI49759.1 hypothetical protein [Enterobacter ludwigii]